MRPTSTESAEELRKTLDGFLDAAFPVKTHTVRSTDDPWIYIGIRKKIRLRKRIFKKEGRSQRWKRIKHITEEKIKEKKKEYFLKMKDLSKSKMIYIYTIKQ